MWVALVVSLGGVCLLILGQEGDEDQKQTQTIGLIVLIFGIFMVASEFLMLRHLRSLHYMANPIYLALTTSVLSMVVVWAYAGSTATDFLLEIRLQELLYFFFIACMGFGG